MKVSESTLGADALLTVGSPQRNDIRPAQGLTNLPDRVLDEVQKSLLSTIRKVVAEFVDDLEPRAATGFVPATDNGALPVSPGAGRLPQNSETDYPGADLSKLIKTGLQKGILVGPLEEEALKGGGATLRGLIDAVRGKIREYVGSLMNVPGKTLLQKAADPWLAANELPWTADPKTSKQPSVIPPEPVPLGVATDEQGVSAPLFVASDGRFVVVASTYTQEEPATAEQGSPAPAPTTGSQEPQSSETNLCQGLVRTLNSVLSGQGPVAQGIPPGDIAAGAAASESAGEPTDGPGLPTVPGRTGVSLEAAITDTESLETTVSRTPSATETTTSLAGQGEQKVPPERIPNPDGLMDGSWSSRTHVDRGTGNQEAAKILPQSAPTGGGEERMGASETVVQGTFKSTQAPTHGPFVAGNEAQMPTTSAQPGPHAGTSMPQSATPSADVSLPMSDEQIISRVIRFVLDVDSVLEEESSGTGKVPAEAAGKGNEVPQTVHSLAGRLTLDRTGIRGLVMPAVLFPVGTQPGESVGVTVGEDGMLRLSPSLLASGLSSNKEQTLTILRSLGGSLAERIDVIANPFMGAYVYDRYAIHGRSAPSGKKTWSLEQELTEEQGALDKRLKELESLIGQSAVLRDWFQQRDRPVNFPLEVAE